MRNVVTLRSAPRPPPPYRGALTRLLLIPILAAAFPALACSVPTTPSTTTYSGSFSGEELLSSGTNGVAS